MARWITLLGVAALCAVGGAFLHNEVDLQVEPPSVRVERLQTATVTCCYKSARAGLSARWEGLAPGAGNRTASRQRNVTLDDRVTRAEGRKGNWTCVTLTIRQATEDDTQLYRCSLRDNTSSTPLLSPGTYLKIYNTSEKLINLSERTKNHLIVLQAVILMLCVLLPGTALLCKAKQQSEKSLDFKKKRREEEENIYEGLNLDECSMYHDISRSKVHGPYEDVANLRGSDIQLEKP
nr:PREDICTED: B-cell antigen receptor complex-associated protein alpha chain [Lepisosteus oculatus]